MPKVNGPKRPNQSKPEEPHPQWQQPPEPLSSQPNFPQWKYQPQQPQYPPTQPPKKKPGQVGKIGFSVLFVIVVLIVALASGNLFSHPTPTNTTPDNSQLTQPTDQLSQSPVIQTWTTTHTFTGNGIKKTEIFTVPDDWKILWSCDPASFNNYPFNLIVTVTGPSATPIDLAINTLCKPGNTSGETEEHQGGQVYLDVNSEGSWTLIVQELI